MADRPPDEPADRSADRFVTDRFVADRQLWRGLALAALVGAGAGLLVALFGRLAQENVPELLAVAVLAVGAVLAQLVRSSVAEMVPVPDPPRPTASSTAEYFRPLRQLERRLSGASEDVARFDRAIRPMLAELATDRLRHRRGVDLVREPERARSILGDELWTLVAQPNTPTVRPPGRARLVEYVTAIEAI